ncbi:MAG: pyrroline-5-carboxylate reductase [Christensenellaceae bacterium]
MIKLGVIGCGKMGSAIIEGLLLNKTVLKENIKVYEVNGNVLADLKNKGFEVCPDVNDLVKKSNVLLFAIKPQELKNLLSHITVQNDDLLIMSIMAGVKISTLQSHFKTARIARIMPNTCAQIGLSASSVCFNGLCDEADKKTAETIIRSFGTVAEITEDLMDEVIPLAGSFTAYAYLFMKSFVESGIKRGVDEDIAKSLVISSMIGSAKMYEKFGDIDTLIKNVCSKGGTTLAGLDKLYEGDFQKVIENCYNACADRSKELSKL